MSTSTSQGMTRWVPLLCLVVCFAVFAAACGDGGGAKPSEDEAADPSTPQDGDPAGEAGGDDLLAAESGDAPVFATAAECGECHVEIYKEWKESYHGRAMTDPLFLEFTADINKEECIRCHAPVALRQAGFATPIARTEHRQDGVSCLTCHQIEGGVAGPSKGLTGACNPTYDPAQTDVVKICFACHNQHNTGNEWLRGPYSPNAPEPRTKPEMNCIECHMEPVERPLVPGGKVRKGRRHTWPGGHSLHQLRKAAKLDVKVEPLDGGGFRFRAFVTNHGAGHAIPTDARHRSFDTYVKITESDGRVLLDPLDFNQQSKAHVGNYRLQYRNSGLRDTQIQPGERVSGLGKFPGMVEIPEARSGKGEVWLVYRLTPRDVLDSRSLDVPTPHDIGNEGRAVLVQKLEFTYGP